MSIKTLGHHLSLIILTICASAGNASAQEETEFSFTAALAPHYATGSANLDDRDHLIGGTGFLDLTVTNDNLTAFFQSQPQIPGEGEPVPRNHLARQAWVKVAGKSFDIQAGRQLLIWGRADRFNPTDNLTPHDYRFLTIDDQGQRFGATGLVGRYFLSDDLTLTGVYLPFFTSSQLPEGIIPAGVPRPQEQGSRYFPCPRSPVRHQARQERRRVRRLAQLLSRLRAVASIDGSRHRRPPVREPRHRRAGRRLRLHPW